MNVIKTFQDTSNILFKWLSIGYAPFEKTSKTIRSQGWKHVRSGINWWLEVKVLKVCPQTTGSATPESLTEEQILKPQWQCTQSKTLGTGPSNLHFRKPSWSFWTLKSENHCSNSGVSKLQLTAKKVLVNISFTGTQHIHSSEYRLWPPSRCNGRVEWLPQKPYARKDWNI